MDFWLPIIGRWLHIFSASSLIGATVFQYLALQPAAATLSAEAHSQLREALVARWRKVVHPLSGMVLVSGLYNYIGVMIPLHKGDGLYHALLGVKMILGIVVLAISIMLVGRSKFSQSLRVNTRRFVGINLILVVIILMLGGFLRVRDILQQVAM